MLYQNFKANEKLTAAAAVYTAQHGGGFYGGEPDGGLMYEPEDGEAAYIPPEGADAAQVLQDLRSGKQLPELWPELEYDPDNVY